MRSVSISLFILVAAASAIAGDSQTGGTVPADPILTKTALTLLRTTSIDAIGKCLQFGCDAAAPAALQMSAATVGKLAVGWRATLPETADGSPLFVPSVVTPSGRRDLIIVSTTAGRTMALDARDGVAVWSTTPPDGPRWTSTSPVVDPKLTYVYSYGLDGYVHRYSLESGAEKVGGGWPELVTLKPDVEKCSSALRLATTKDGRSWLYATIAGYPDPGDAGDYQGHLVAIDIASGVQHVFNALCSDRSLHFDASGSDATDCTAVQAGIWPRAGGVYDSTTDRLFLTVGNGPYDGVHHWGSSVVAIRPDGTTDAGAPLDSYTPSDYAYLTAADLDLGSTTVAVLPDGAGGRHLGVVGGKDSQLRLIDLTDMSGQHAAGRLGGELQVVPLPQWGEVLTQPLVWTAPDGSAWVFVASAGGLTAFRLDRSGAAPQLRLQWSSDVAGATPVISDGVLYYARDNELRAVDPLTGKLLWHDTSIGHIHWETPLVVGRWLYLEDADLHLWAFTTPSR